jgi:hypothetical protein
MITSLKLNDMAFQQNSEDKSNVIYIYVIKINRLLEGNWLEKSILYYKLYQWGAKLEP